MNSDATQIPLLPPSLSDVYTPISVIGQGAYAMVILAQSRRTEELVAVKHFRIGKKDRKSFFQELRFVLALNHPHITRCLDLFTADDETADLIFEYADLGSLRGVLETQDSLSIKDSLRYCHHVSRALMHAHDEGILHRDLKPENILLFQADNKPVAKLTDYGIAKALGSQSHTFTSIGSPAYMAPEQFYDQYGLTSDIYGLGIVFYELLHGRVPFSGSPASIFRAHLEETPDIKDVLPNEVKVLLKRMLAKQPEDRPSAQELSDLFEEIRAKLLNDDAESFNESLSEIKDSFGKNRPDASIFGEMFSEPKKSSSPPINDSETRQDPVAEQREEQDPFSAFDNDERDENEDPFAGFGKESKHDISDDPMRAQPETEEIPEVESFDSTEEETARARISFDIFDNEEFGDSPSRVLFLPKEYELQTAGRLNIKQMWSRAVATTCKSLLNLDDNQSLVLHATDGLFEMKENGKRGKRIYEGAPEYVGLPSAGILPIVENGEVRILSQREILDKRWYIDAKIDQAAVSPLLDALVITLDNTVYYHDVDCNLIWNASIGKRSQTPFVTFDHQGRLMMLSTLSDDRGVYYYDKEGHELASHWIPGPIQAATLSRGARGTWLIAKRRSSFELLRVAFEGVSSGCRLDRGFVRLAGGRDWVAGIDQEDDLWVVDPLTGDEAKVPVEGELISFEEGPNTSILYVLEQRGGILKYLTAYEVSTQST